ncbi:MAG: hypothetical protein ACI9TO_001244, partial [Rickettsiales bacterium]
KRRNFSASKAFKTNNRFTSTLLIAMILDIKL